MEVCAQVEGIDETPVARELGEDAQLDLRVVGNDQPSALGMARETTAIFNCMRYSLDLRIRARESSRRGANLTKVSVHTPRYRIDELDHILTVTRQRLLHSAILEQLRDDWIFGRQRLQFPVSCGIGNRYPESFERLRELLVRIEIDFGALRTTNQRPLQGLLGENLLQFIR